MLLPMPWCGFLVSRGEQVREELFLGGDRRVRLFCSHFQRLQDRNHD